MASEESSGNNSLKPSPSDNVIELQGKKLLKKSTSAPMVLIPSVVMETITDEESDSEDGISISVPSESELSTTSVSREDGRDDTSQESSTSSEQTDLTHEWDTIMNLWKGIEKDVEKHNKKHPTRPCRSTSTTTSPALPPPPPEVERSISMPTATSGLDQLQRLVIIMEQLSDLKQENYELKKHSDYLEGMKDLQEMRNQCLAMHCQCDAAQRFLFPPSIDFVFGDDDDDEDVADELDDGSESKNISDMLNTADLDANRKRSRSLDVNENAADVFAKEFRRVKSLSRWEKVKEKFSYSKNGSVKRKKRLSSRRSEPNMCVFNEPEVIPMPKMQTEGGDINETKSIDSGACFDPEDQCPKRKRVALASHHVDISESDKTFLEIKSAKWLEVDDFPLDRDCDSPSSCSSVELDVKSDDEIKEALKKDFSQLNSNANAANNGDLTLNRSTSLPEGDSVERSPALARSHESEKEKGKTLTLGKMKDIILRKESGKRKSGKKTHGEQEHSSKEKIEKTVDVSMTTATASSEAMNDEDGEISFISPKLDRKGQLKETSPSFNKKLKGWDKVKQALVRKDLTMSGKSRTHALDDSILLALKDENLDVSTLLGGVSEEWTRKMQEWETKKKNKASGMTGSPGTKRRVIRARSSSPTSLSTAMTGWLMPSATIDVDAVQANLSDQFRKKLTEWEKKKNRLSVPITPAPLDRLRTFSSSDCASADMSDVVDELQKNMTDKFSKKWEEWEKKKQKGTVIPKLERKLTTKTKKDKTKVESKEKPKEGKESSEIKAEPIYSTETVTVFKTKDGNLVYEGVSQEFERKLKAWEKMKSVSITSSEELDRTEHWVAASNSCSPQQPRLSTDKISPSFRSRTESDDSDNTQGSSVFAFTHLTPVIIEPASSSSSVTPDTQEYDYHCSADRIEDEFMMSNLPSHSTPLPLSESDNSFSLSDSPSKSLQDSGVQTVMHYGSPKKYQDQSVVVDILSEEQFNKLSVRNAMLSREIAEKNSDLQKLQTEFARCQQELECMVSTHKKQLDNYRKVAMTTGQFSEVKPNDSELKQSLQDLQTQMNDLKAYGSRVRQEKSSLEKTMIDKHLKYDVLVSRLQSEILNLRQSNLNLASSGSQQDIPTKESATSLPNTQDIISQLQQKLQNVQSALLKKDQFISNVEWNLLDKEANIALLNSHIERQALELNFIRKLKQHGALRRVQSFGGRDKAFMECEGQSPRRPHSSKFTIKFSKPCNNQDTEEIFHLTSSLGGKVSTCKKTSLTAIPSMVVHPLSSKFTDLKDVQINTEVHNVQDVKKQIMQNKVKEKRKQWAESRDTKTSAGESKQCLDEVIQRECDPQLKLSLSLPKKDILGKLDSHRGVVDESERLEINEKEVEEEEENLEPLVIEEDGDEENPATKSTEEDLSSCVSSPFTAVTKPFKIVEYRKTPSLLCCSSHKHSVVSTSSSDDDTRPWPSKSDQSDTSKTASRDDQIIKSKTSVVLEVSSAVRNRNALKSQSLDCGIDKNRTSDLNDKSMSNLEKSSVSMDDVQKELLTDHAMVQALSAECMSPYPGLFAPIPVRLKKETQETKSAEACPYVDSVPSAIEHTPANECLDTKMQSQVQRRIENIISRTARSRPSKDDRESGDIRYPRARSVTRENRSRKVHEKHSQAENERKEITSRNQRSRSVPRDTRNFRSPSLKEITSPSNGSYLSVSSTKTLAPLSPTIERVRLAKSPICQHLDMNSSTGSVITKEHINNSTLTTSDSTLHVKQKENISPCLEQQCSRSLKITLELRPRSSSLGSKSREKFRSERPRSGGNGNEKTKKLPPQFKLKLNELNNLTSFKDIQKKFSDMQYSSSPSVLESSIDPTIGGKVDKIDDLNPSKVKKLSQAFSTGALVEKKGMPTCLESANQSVTVTPAHVVHACKNVSEQVEMFQNIKDKPERVRKRSMSGTNMLKILQPLSFDSGTDSSSSSPMPTRKKNDNEVYARSNKVTSSASDQRAEFFHQKHQNPRVKFTPKVSTEQISLDTSDRDSGDMTDARTTGHSEEWFVGRDVPVVAMGTKRKIPDKLRLTTNKPSSLRLDSEDKQLFFPEMSPSTYRLKKDVKGSPTSPKKASPIERYSPLNALNRKKLEVDNLQSGKLSSSQISRFQEERKEEGNSRREKKLELLKTGRQQIQNSLDSRGLPSREGKGDSSEVTHKSKVDWKLDGQMSEKERWFSKKMYKVTNPDDNDMHVTSLYIDESVDCL